MARDWIDEEDDPAHWGFWLGSGGVFEFQDGRKRRINHMDLVFAYIDRDGVPVLINVDSPRGSYN